MGEQNGWRGEDIAEQIRQALNQALSMSNFDQLNRTISDTVDSALGEAREQFERYRNRVERRSEEPVDSQAASWVPDEADAAGGTAGSSAGDRDWRHGTRRPGDDGRYHYETGTGGAQYAGDGLHGTGGGQGAFASEPYWYGGQRLPQTPAYRVRWRGRVSGILMSAFGALGTAVFGLFTFLLLTMSLIVIDGTGSWIATLLLALATGGFGLMTWAGIASFSRVNRLKLYLEEIRRGGKSYCEVAGLARTAGRSESFVRKDLKKILALGMLPDARMDEQGAYLMMDAETYRHYTQSQEALKARQEQERLERQKEAQISSRDGRDSAQAGGTLSRDGRDSAQAGGTSSRDGRTPAQAGGTSSQDAASSAGAGGAAGSGAGGTGNAAVDAAIAHGEEQKETIDAMRRSMPENPMTEKLLRLDRVLGRLFETLRRYPDQLDELERFMEYYLPTTVKLVTAYREFSAVEFPGENITQAKTEIEETMETINGAFEKLLDDMYEDTAFDVMTDASVLQTILKREGLTEGDFHEPADSGGTEQNRQDR